MPSRYEKKILGEWVLAARERMGFTQEQLAEMIGLKNRETLSNWENGKAYPQPRYRRAMEKVLCERAPQLSSEGVTEVFVEYDSNRPSLRIPRFALGRVLAIPGGTVLPLGDVELTAHEAAVSDRAYEINDDSMAPWFRFGDLIGVTTRETPEPGQLVVAEVRGCIVFRRYEGQDGDHHILSPLQITNLHKPIVSLHVTFIGIYRWHRALSADGRI